MNYVDAVEATKLNHNRLYATAIANELSLTGVVAIDGILMNTLQVLCTCFPTLPPANIHLPNIQPDTYAALASTGLCRSALMEVEAYIRTLTPEQLRVINAAYLDFCGSVWGCEGINSRPLECIHYLLTHCHQDVFVLATTFSVRSGPNAHASRNKDMYETIEEDMLLPCFQYSGYRVAKRYIHKYAREINGVKGTNMVFYIHVLVRDNTLDNTAIYFPRSKKRCNGVVVIEGWRNDPTRRFLTDASGVPKYIRRVHHV